MGRGRWTREEASGEELPQTADDECADHKIGDDHARYRQPVEEPAHTASTRKHDVESQCADAETKRPV